MKSDEIFQTISKYHPELSLLGVSRIGLFGSALRGEMRPESDLDFLVEFRSGEKIMTTSASLRKCWNVSSVARSIC